MSSLSEHLNRDAQEVQSHVGSDQKAQPQVVQSNLGPEAMIATGQERESEYKERREKERREAMAWTIPYIRNAREHFDNWKGKPWFQEAQPQVGPEPSGQEKKKHRKAKGQEHFEHWKDKPWFDRNACPGSIKPH